VPASSPPQTSLRTRLWGLVHELGKFGTVGGICFLIDAAIFNVLLHADMETLVAKTISTAIATTLAFTGNRFWTWRHREHTHMGRQYAMFFLLNAVGLGIALVCLWISHYGLGQFWPALQTPLADTVSGVIIGSAFGSLFRFWSYRRFVFPAAIAAEPTVAESTRDTDTDDVPAPNIVPRM
jgi:putative flippase GtrA